MILVLPSHIECDAIPIIDWLSKNMQDTVYVNLMGQYFPYYKANEYEGINRGLTPEEFGKAAKFLKNSNLKPTSHKLSMLMNQWFQE